MEEQPQPPKDEIWFVFPNEKKQVVSVVLEGFGFSEIIDEAEKHPRYDEICSLVKSMATDIMEN